MMGWVRRVQGDEDAVEDDRRSDRHGRDGCDEAASLA
jgi:hypothetical protein